MERKPRERNIFSFVRSDEVINDVLSIFSEKEDFYFAGGLVGVQSYIPENQFRQTSDIDMILLEATPSPTKVRELLSYEIEELMERDFTVNIEKARETININLERDNDRLMLQTKRRNPKNFDKHFDRISDEYLSAQPIELYGVKSLVTSPEYLIADKLSRMSAFNRSGRLTKDKVKRSYTMDFRESDLMVKLNEFENERTNLMKSILESDNFEEKRTNLRYFADIYDISVLDEFNTLHKDKLQQAMLGYTQDKQTFATVIGKQLLRRNEII
jgi:hypothetical protein